MRQSKLVVGYLNDRKFEMDCDARTGHISGYYLEDGYPSMSESEIDKALAEYAPYWGEA